MAIDADRLAYGRRVSAEFSLPVVIRQHDDRIGAGLLAFLALEETAQFRLYAKHGKIIAGDHLYPLAIGLLSGDAQMSRAHVDGEHVREDVQTLTIVAEVQP